MKAERILAGLFGVFMSVCLLVKSLQLLVQALQLRAALADNPGLHLEVKEAFFTFLFELLFGLALGWWGISKFRRPKSVAEGVSEEH